MQYFVVLDDTKKKKNKDHTPHYATAFSPLFSNINFLDITQCRSPTLSLKSPTTKTHETGRQDSYWQVTPVRHEPSTNGGEYSVTITAESCFSTRKPVNIKSSPYSRLWELREEVEIHLYSFFNLGARWRWVVNSMSRPLYPPVKRPGTHCMRLGGLPGSGGVHKIPPPTRIFFVFSFTLSVIRTPFLVLIVLHFASCLFTYNTTQTIHAPCAIRTPNPSNRQAANPRLKPFDHWDRRDSNLEPSRSQQFAIPTMLSRPTFISQTKVNSKHQLPSTSVLLKYEYNKALFKAFLL
jgi:hypothetical protein